jgi:hypothetical protein
VRNLFTSRPQVRVTFYPQSFANLGRTITISVDTDKKDDLISVQTVKDIRQPAGHFTVVMVPKPLQSGGGETFRYQDILRPGDLVVIEMGPDKPQPDSTYQQFVKEQGYSGLEPVMIGSIDDVRESTQFNSTDGRPERTLTIVGRDFGKYLVDDQVWWDSWSQPARAIFGLAPEIDQWLRSKKLDGVAAGAVQLILKWLEQHFDINFTFSVAKRQEKRLFRDLLRYSLTTASPSIAAPLNLESFQGAPWALMERVASPPLFTLSIDTRRNLDTNILLDPTGGAKVDNENTNYFNTDFGKWDAQPALLLYRTPWSNRLYDDWLNLPVRVVEDVDLISRDIGRGNEEVSNTWRVWTDAQGVFKTQSGGDIGDARKLRDYDSIQRYGERPLIITSPFISGQGGADQLKTVQKYSFMLKDFNRWNELFLNGRFTIKGMAAVKCGDKLWHWDGDYGDYTEKSFDGGVDYYVEAVTQEFSAFTRWTTTVMVTRGQKHRSRGQTLDYEDINLDADDLANPNSTNRNKVRRQAKRLWVWGQG